MSSILDDQLRLMALKQYGLIKSIKTPDISEEDLRLILKNTENKTIKQLAAEKLQYLNLHPRLGVAGSIARAQRINGLKYRYKVLMKKLKFGIFYIMLT